MKSEPTLNLLESAPYSEKVEQCQHIYTVVNITYKTAIWHNTEKRTYDLFCPACSHMKKSVRVEEKNRTLLSQRARKDYLKKKDVPEMYVEEKEPAQ